MTFTLSVAGLPAGRFGNERRQEVGPTRSNAYRAWLDAGGAAAGAASVATARGKQGLEQIFAGPRPSGTAFSTSITLAPNSVLLITCPTDFV